MIFVNDTSSAEVYLFGRLTAFRSLRVLYTDSISVFNPDEDTDNCMKTLYFDIFDKPLMSQLNVKQELLLLFI